MMSPEAQQRVMQRVCVSGALPVSRDTSSYAAVKSMLEGGASGGQRSYVFGGEEGPDRATAGPRATLVGGGTAPMGATMDEDMFRAKLRAEAKERSNGAAMGADGGGMGVVAEAKTDEDQDGDQGQTEESKGEAVEEEEARKKKERKERKKRKEKKKRKEQRRKEKEMGLLGNLPSLDGGRGGEGALEFINLDLELPEKMKKMKSKEKDMTPSKYLKAEGGAPGVPKEFGCAINGHLMKEPVKTPGGQVFERETIELWLRTRGSVCPITGVPLTVEDLEEDATLRAEITRWQIRKTSGGAGGAGGGTVLGLGGGEVEDDVYDF